MNTLLHLLFRLTLCGGGVSLLLLLGRPVLKKLPAQWRRLAAGACLLFFLIPFQLPLLSSRPTPDPEPLAAARDAGGTLEAVDAPSEYISESKGAAGDRGKTVPRDFQTPCLTLWLGGAVLLMLCRWANWRRFSAAVTTGSRCPSDELLTVYSDLCQEMGIRRPPQLLCCGGVGAPMLAGAFRPRLLLPDMDLEEMQLELILRHELTHYQRGDTRLKLAAMAVSLLHWWNPLAYLPGYLLQIDCELACDEQLALPMDAQQRKLYGLTILELMSCVKTPLAAPFSRKCQVKGRLEAILHASPPTKAVRVAGAAVTVALILCGAAASSLLAYAMPAPNERESTTTVDYLPDYYKPQEPTSPDSDISSEPDPADTQSRLVRQLLDSISLTDGQVRFTIPAETPPLGKKWFIHISGRSPDGFSLHWLERESEGFLWEPGKSYSFPLDPVAFLGDGETVDSQAVSELCNIQVRLVQINQETGRMIEGAGGDVQPVSQWAFAQGKRYTGMEAPPEGTGPQPPFPAGSPDKNPNPGILEIETPLSTPIESGQKLLDYSGFLGHFGVDYNAPRSSGILAAADGSVTEVRETGDGSRSIVVAHENGLETIYSLCGNITVEPGDTVSRGQKMAEIDRTGEWAPHLHFEVHLNNEPVDPTPYLARGQWTEGVL